MIRIALTKGRIESESLKLLTKAGYDCSELLDKEKKGRKLLFKLGDEDIELVLAKAADVITYVEHGVCDAVEVVREDHDVARVLCDRASAPHCKADVGGSEGGRVIDPVARHTRDPSRALRHSDESALVGRKRTRDHRKLGKDRLKLAVIEP